jgi:hypothetical protein
LFYKSNGDFSNSPNFEEKIPYNFIHIVAKHGNQLVVRLFTVLKKNGISVPKFSLETGIKKDRVYKWMQEGTSPKADDEKIIRAWLAKIEKAPRGTLAQQQADFSTVEHEGFMEVRYLPIYGQAGYLNQLEQSTVQGGGVANYASS